MPSREGIEASSADALRAYQRYERKRILIVIGLFVLVAGTFIGLLLLYFHYSV